MPDPFRTRDDVNPPRPTSSRRRAARLQRAAFEPLARITVQQLVPQHPASARVRPSTRPCRCRRRGYFLRVRRDRCSTSRTPKGQLVSRRGSPCLAPAGTRCASVRSRRAATSRSPSPHPKGRSVALRSTVRRWKLVAVEHADREVRAPLLRCLAISSRCDAAPLRESERVLTTTAASKHSPRSKSVMSASMSPRARGPRESRTSEGDHLEELSSRTAQCRGASARAIRPVPLRARHV